IRFRNVVGGVRGVSPPIDLAPSSRIKTATDTDYDETAKLYTECPRSIRTLFYLICPDNGPRATTMPTEDDYGRRQISSSQPQHPPTNTPSPSPLPSHCPAGCVPAKNPLGSDRVPSGVFGGDRAVFGSDRTPSGVFGSDRTPSGVFGSDRAPSGVFGSDRASSGVFGGDRPGSDRLPSGERYQGVSERFPLGERPQTSVSADRLAGKEQQQQQQLQLQGSGYCQDDRPNYQSERFVYNILKTGTFGTITHYTLFYH
ncbi:unnamed protein product, partial [Phaedon cochleariae]